MGYENAKYPLPFVVRAEHCMFVDNTTPLRTTFILCYTFFRMKSSRLIAFFTAVSTLLGVATPALAFDPEYIISDAELTDSYSMDLNQVRSFLSSRGALGDMRLPDHEGRTRWAADIIWYAAQNNGINPKVLLVMLQKEQSLIEDEDPSQKQLDWAMGYAVCDSCSLSDGSLSRWQGFGKQVNSASMQFIDGYLADINTHGVTAGKYGPDVPVSIDGETIVPQNSATAALYAYTPHFHGNQNFAYLWQAWFGREYPSGTLVQVPGEDGVWLLQAGYRRAITSASALASRFNPDLIVQISQSTLDSYPEGTPISLPNYSLVQDDDGTIFLLVDDALREIDSMETFRSIGFSEDELVAISNAERKSYSTGVPITSSTVAPQGQLYQLTTNGAVFYIQDGKRHPLFDVSILNTRFAGKRIQSITPLEIEQFAEGSPIKLPDGALVKTVESPTVYVISEGMRREIPSENVFTSFGYQWTNIIDVPENVLELHPLGEPLDAAIADRVQSASN